MSLDVRMLTVGPLQENAYLLRPAGGERAVLVDPGEEADRLLSVIGQLRVQLDAILLTHTHFDHVGAVAAVARATGAPVYVPELERDVLANINDYVRFPGFGPFESYDADETVAGGERLQLAGLDIDVIFTPAPGQKLDDSFGEPAWLEVSASPPSLLVEGAGRSTDLYRSLVLSAEPGATGVLQVVAQVATCDAEAEFPACHLTRQDWGVPVRVTPGAAARLPLVLRGLDA